MKSREDLPLSEKKCGPLFPKTKGRAVLPCFAGLCTVLPLSCINCPELPYDRLDKHGFFRLPTSFDIDDFSLMDDFISTMPATSRKKLFEAISGRSPFRNFKDEIRRMGQEQKWYDFQADAYKRKAIAWCEEHDLEWEE